MTALPGWDELSDTDRGAVLLHLHKRDWEGDEYAEENYPAEYFDHPDLTALPPAEACAHAVSMAPAVAAELTVEEYERLYELALDADRDRMLAGRDGARR